MRFMPDMDGGFQMNLYRHILTLVYGMKEFIEPENFSEDALNEIELANIDVIKAYEASQGF